MDFDRGLEVADEAVFLCTGRRLSEIEVSVLRGCWKNQTYETIAIQTGYSVSYLNRTVAPKLWQTLAKVLGEKVGKKNFRFRLEQFYRSQFSPDRKAGIAVSSNESRNLQDCDGLDKSEFSPQESLSSGQIVDWGEAIDVSVFYGRTQELAELTAWIVQDRCRLIAVLGMGGIGKTALSVKLAQQLQGQFEFVIWRSLRNAPQLDQLLTELLCIFPGQSSLTTSTSLDAQIAQLMHFLRQHQCLLVLDNLESILQEGRVTGSYRSGGYENYEELLRQVGEVPHQSCLVLTSREKPETVATLEGDCLPVRSCLLTGLPVPEGNHLFDAKGLSQDTLSRQQLIEAYGGNPLALKIVATSIRELFDGDVDAFLQVGTLIFNGLRRLLDPQFARLTPVEKQVMYWLAIQPSSVTISELQSLIRPSISRPRLLETLGSLLRRSLIEQSIARFTQHPLVTEYILEEAIEQSEEALCQQLGCETELAVLMTLYAGVGQVNFRRSQFTASITAYQKMLAVARRYGDTAQEADALYNIAYGLHWKHEFEPAIDYAQQAYTLAIATECQSVVAASQFLIGYIHAVTAKLEDSFRCATEALQLSRNSSDRHLEGLNIYLLGFIHNWKGDYQTALQLGEQGIQLGQIANLPTIQLMCLWERGLTQCGRGEYILALSDLNAGMALSHRLGDQVWKCRILNTLGWLYSELYDIEPAICHNQAALTLAKKIGDPEIIRNAEINLGDCYLLQGDLVTAEAYLIKVYHDSQQQGKQGDEWMKWRYVQHCCHSLGLVRLKQGDPAQALALAQECVQLAEPTHSRKNLVKGWRLMGQALLAQGQIPEAAAWLDQAIDLARQLGNPPQCWQTGIARGDFYTHCGLTQSALTAYQEALNTIEHTIAQLTPHSLAVALQSCPVVKSLRGKCQ